MSHENPRDQRPAGGAGSLSRAAGGPGAGGLRGADPRPGPGAGAGRLRGRRPVRGGAVRRRHQRPERIHRLRRAGMREHLRPPGGPGAAVPRPGTGAGRRAALSGRAVRPGAGRPAGRRRAGCRPKGRLCLSAPVGGPPHRPGRRLQGPPVRDGAGGVRDVCPAPRLYAGRRRPADPGAPPRPPAPGGPARLRAGAGKDPCQHPGPAGGPAGQQRAFVRGRRHRQIQRGEGSTPPRACAWWK